MKTILSNHTSPETAYLVDDYPYGFRLRCKIRYWLETNKKGTRFCSQTTNPKASGEVWNKPKCSTYSEISGVMYLDENNHVQWAALNQYADTKECRAYLDAYGEAATNYKGLVYMVKLKENFDKAKARLGNPEYGTALFKQAYLEAIGETRKEMV